MESEIERLRKKVENFPSASLYTRLAELLRSSGDAVAADQACRRCIKEFPRSGQAYVILGEILLSLKRNDEALALLRTGVERDPRCYQAHLLLADHASERGVAEAHLRAILSFKPGDTTATARLASLGGTVATTTPRPGIKPVPGSAASLPALPATASQVLRTVGVQTTTRQAPPRIALLDGLCSEAGVTGVAVCDTQGRVVVARNLVQGQEDVLAAFGAEVGRALSQTAIHAGAGAMSSWSVAASAGQVLSFQRDGSYCVLILAAAKVRPAMLELRARQVLIDLGAA